jgi:hypothetical protein
VRRINRNGFDFKRFIKDCKDKKLSNTGIVQIYKSDRNRDIMSERAGRNV